MKETFTRQEVIELLNMGLRRTDTEEETIIRNWEKSKDKIYPTGILLFKRGVYRNIDWERNKEYNIPYQKFCSDAINGGAIIWSVQNTAGETLNIGQEVKHNHGIIGTIDTFSIKDNLLLAHVKNYGSFVIDDLHPKLLIFKTEDGYEIKDGERLKIYCVSKKYFTVSASFLCKGDSNFNDVSNANYLFIDSYNAEKYADLNKTLFSKQQILDAISQTENQMGDVKNVINLQELNITLHN